jgi:hypothetical protein
VSTTFTKGVWQLVQWTGDGTSIWIRVNSGMWQVGSGGTISSVASALDVGRNPAQNSFLHGRIAEIGFSALRLANTDFDSIKAYVDTHYQLTL